MHRRRGRRLDRRDPDARSPARAKRGRRLQVVQQPADLVRAHERPDLRDPGRDGVDRRLRLLRRPGSGRARSSRIAGRLSLSCAEALVCGLHRRPELGDRLLQVRLLGRERRHRRVEVLDELARPAPRAAELVADPRRAADQPRQVVAAPRRAAPSGRSPRRAAPARRGASACSAPGRPPCPAVDGLVGVLLGRRLVLEGRAELLERRLQILARVRCSDVSSWSIWTGVAVCETGIVSPSEIVGAEGVPGSMSTKKLPSRKMRGRTLSVASLWIGRPASLTSIVTTALLVPSWPSTLTTLPMFTPAMRTGDLSRGCWRTGRRP